PHSLKALVVFKNLMYPALIRTVHVYRLEEGVEEEVVEREYVFHKEGDYEEIGFCKVLTLQSFCHSAQSEGQVNGVWVCIYVFSGDCLVDVHRIPTILSISRNPKLASIPTLAADLERIAQLSRREDCIDPPKSPTEEVSEENNDNEHELKRNEDRFGLDLNSVPYMDSEDEESNQSAPGIVERKKRAAPKDIARLALEDLAKYFDLPIAEASKNLKVGLTVLKKKCREFGIPRWPHRKIKSLDGLIRDLQEEVKRQQEADKAAATVVAKRQRMIESEKESIERKPFMEIQRETKKFRQDIFKKRHRARVLENQCRTLSLF
ncbi:hypothetical protein RJ640_027806, partial [Escallonia rubra]